MIDKRDQRSRETDNNKEKRGIIPVSVGHQEGTQAIRSIQRAKKEALGRVCTHFGYTYDTVQEYDGEHCGGALAGQQCHYQTHLVFALVGLQHRI